MANEEIRLANMEKVLQVAVALFIEHGIENTTREMLARSSGLSRRSIERYFPAKSDYVVQAAIWYAKVLAQRLESEKMLDGDQYTADQVLKAFFAELKAELVEEPRIFVCFAEAKGFIYRNCEDRANDYQRLLDAIGWQRILQKIFEKGGKDGTLKSNHDPEKIARYLANTIVSFFSNLVLLYDRDPATLEESAERYLTDMWKMCCKS